MKLNLILLLLVTLSLSIVTTPSKANTDTFRVHGLSAFTEKNQTMLSAWLTKGVNSTRATLGVYPQVLELYVYPKKSNQPVPWAHTRRDVKESVHLYVDSRFPLKKFVDDWTIYHEIAHLALPYLGSKYSWFSEGFASYMQYQIMAEASVLKGTLEERYSKKIKPHLRWFNSDYSAADVARRLMSQRKYPAAYWGSAWFFILADKKLQEKHNVSLTQLIELYQDCCRAKDEDIWQLMKSLDSIIEDTIFTQLLQRYEKDKARTLYPISFAE